MRQCGWSGDHPAHHEPRRKLATSVYLEAISCPTSRVCHAAGTATRTNGSSTGVFVSTTDAGRTWHTGAALLPQKSGAHYSSINCPSVRVCYVTGNSGAVEVTRDGGAHWRSETAPLSEGAASIVCPSVEVCHVIGDFSSIVSTPN